MPLAATDRRDKLALGFADSKSHRRTYPLCDKSGRHEPSCPESYTIRELPGGTPENAHHIGSVPLIQRFIEPINQNTLALAASASFPLQDLSRYNPFTERLTRPDARQWPVIMGAAPPLCWPGAHGASTRMPRRLYEYPARRRQSDAPPCGTAVTRRTLPCLRSCARSCRRCRGHPAGVDRTPRARYRLYGPAGGPWCGGRAADLGGHPGHEAHLLGAVPRRNVHAPDLSPHAPGDGLWLPPEERQCWPVCAYGAWRPDRGAVYH